MSDQPSPADLSARERRLLIALADPQGPPDIGLAAGDRLSAILAAAVHHRVLPTVLARLPENAINEVPARFREQVIWDASLVMMLRTVASQILKAFAERGIPARIVKGEHFSERIYPKPFWRPYTDIDLIVDPTRIGETAQVMQPAGFRRGEALVKHDGDYGEEKWVSERAGYRVLVELHRDMINSPTLRRRRHLTYGDLVGSDGEIDRFGDLMIAGVHATLGHGFERLGHVIDVAQAARQLHPQADGRMLAERARACGLTLAIALALAVTGRILADPATLKMARQLDASPPTAWMARLIGPRALLNPRGGRRIALAWRRPLIREWLKRSGGRAS